MKIIGKIENLDCNNSYYDVALPQPNTKLIPVYLEDDITGEVYISTYQEVDIKDSRTFIDGGFD